MMNYSLSINDDGLSYLLARNGHVVEASSSFLEMTGYAKEDIVDKEAHAVWNLLRVDMSECCANYECNCEHFIFTKNLEPRNVFISAPRVSTQDEKIYFFEEVPHSRIEDKFPHVYQMYMDNIKGIAIFNAPEGVLLRANDTFIQYLEEPYDTADCSVGHKVEEIIAGWEESKIKTVWEDVIKLGKSYYQQEYMHDKLKKGLTYWDISLIPIREGSGIKYIISTLTDVTERVVDRNLLNIQAQTIIRQKNELQTVIESLDSALIIVDKQGNYKSLNKCSKKYFSDISFNHKGDFYKHSRVYNMDGSEMKIEDAPISSVINGKRVKKSGYIEIGKGSKKYFETYGAPIFDENGELYSGVISVYDITERVEHENALRSQRDTLYKMLDTLDFPMCRISYPGLGIIEINKKAYRFAYDIGFNTDGNAEMIRPGVNLRDAFPAADLSKSFMILEEIDKKKTAAYINDYEIINEGKKYYVNVVFNPLLDSYGNVEEILMIVVDVTREIVQRKELEQVLKMQEEFFSFISHEFKTPLTVINSAVQVLKLLYKNEISAKSMKYIDKIHQSTLQQIRLVNNLLDITRASAGYLKIHRRNRDIVSITKAISDSVGLYAMKKNIDVKFTSSFSEKIINIDDEKYERILLNLLSNAIKFSPEGMPIYVNVDSKEGKVIIEVKDEGIGIPKDRQRIIFERFVQVDNRLTRQSEGTGLGLCLVKMLVNAMNGEIIVESEEGVGSSFKIFLPDSAGEEAGEGISSKPVDNELVQMLNVEFSNIYFD